MIAFFMANWMNIVVSVMALLEIVSLFAPGSSGTLSGVIKALGSLPGVKDPAIGGK